MRKCLADRNYNWRNSSLRTWNVGRGGFGVFMPMTRVDKEMRGTFVLV